MDKKRILKELKYALRFLPDKVYIQLYYFAAFKKLCNLKSPQTYNEKLTIIPTANLVITVNIQYFFKKKELTKNRIIPHRYHI